MLSDSVTRGYGDHSPLRVVHPTQQGFLREGAVYYWCGGCIEATFRHSLGPGAVRGISPGRRKEVGNPSPPHYFRGGVQAGLPSASRLIAMPGATQLTSP